MSFGGKKPTTITDHHREIVNQLRDEIQEKAEVEEPFSEFEVTQVHVQVVAGTNYFFVIKVGENEYLHARVFKSLPHQGSKLSCHSVRTGKTEDDALEYF